MEHLIQLVFYKLHTPLPLLRGQLWRMIYDSESDILLFFTFHIHFTVRERKQERTGKTILSGSPFSAYAYLSKSNANSIFSIRCDSSSAYTDSSTYDLLTLSRSI